MNSIKTRILTGIFALLPAGAALAGTVMDPGPAPGPGAVAVPVLGVEGTLGAAVALALAGVYVLARRK